MADVLTVMKLQPSQLRSQETIELIVKATGELLETIGFERLSTNLVCKHAKLTPPALYRYFPNKYALLRELGERLMRAQDEAVFESIAQGALRPATLDEQIAQNFRLQSRVNEITRNFPGNISIMRAMRAVPILRSVRLASRDLVASRIAEAIAADFPGVPMSRLLIATRLTTEWGTAATEMVLEEPDRDADETTWEVSRAIAEYYRALAAAGRAGEFREAPRARPAAI